MRFLSIAAVCLIGTAAFAQSPTSAGPPPPAGRGDNPASQRVPEPGSRPTRGPSVTQSSRVRAFNAGSDGQVRSVYLANGSVLDLASGFGPGFDSQIHKGARIRFTGSRTRVGGQSIIVPEQLMVGQQSFSAQPNPGPLPQAGMAQPPDGRRGMPPLPNDRDPARRGPGGELARAGMPPPMPAGPGMPPPPPAGPGGPMLPPPPPPARLNGSGQPPRPEGRRPAAVRPQPGTASGNVPAPAPDARHPAPGGLVPAPALLDSTQPAPAPPAAPNL